MTRSRARTGPESSRRGADDAAGRGRASGGPARDPRSAPKSARRSRAAGPGREVRTRLTREMERDLRRVLARPVPESCRWSRGSCASFREVVQLIVNTGATVELIGGVVRDIVAGRPDDANDIDMQVRGSDRGKLLAVMSDNNLVGCVVDTRANAGAEAGNKFLFAFVGCDTDAKIEMRECDSDPELRETPCNSMRIELAGLALVDPTGVGVEDARARVWRVHPHLKSAEERRAWVAEVGVMRLWRLLKFRDLKGYTVPEEDQRLIYREAAALVAAGAQEPRLFFKLLSEVRDPARWACALVEDASRGTATAGEACAIMRGIFGSGEVVAPAGEPGPKCFSKTCGRREAAIGARKKGP